MEWHFFDIGFDTLNLFSFMLGMVFAFFRQGLFGKRIGVWIFGYFALLAFYYGFAAMDKKKIQSEPVKQEQTTVPTTTPNTPTDEEVNEYFKRRG